jgi:hypothetical protein
MSVVTKSGTTSTTAAKIWRKVQGSAVDAVTAKVDEMKLIGSISNASLAPSLREVTRPVFVERGGGVHAMVEGGAKARPTSPTPQEITVSLNHYQKQLAITELVLMTQAASGTAIQPQFKFQLKEAINAFAEEVGDMFYAPSSAIRATTDTDLSGATTALTLAAGHNQSWITSASYLAGLFRAGAAGGDYVHVLNAGSQVTNAYGQVTSRDASAGTITVTWAGTAPSSTTNGLQIVKANGLENTENAYNKGMVGLLDALTGTSVHSLSQSSYPGWSIGFSDTTGGRLDGTRLEKAIDEIENASGESPDLVIWSKGVKRDVKAQYKAALEFNDAYAIPMDGKVKYEGIEFFTSRKVPPTFAAVLKKSAVEKFFWKPSLDEQDGMAQSDLMESEDYAIRVGRLDLVGNFVWNKRSALGYFRSLTEQ